MPHGASSAASVCILASRAMPRPLSIDGTSLTLDSFRRVVHGHLPCALPRAARPRGGSVGASGDLAPLAHLALPLIGRGTLRVAGGSGGGGAATVAVPAEEGLRRAGLEPLELQAKEGLALINGTQAMTSLLALAALEARRLLKAPDPARAPSADALRAPDSAFAPPLPPPP